MSHPSLYCATALILRYFLSKLLTFRPVGTTIAPPYVNPVNPILTRGVGGGGRLCPLYFQTFLRLLTLKGV